MVSLCVCHHHPNNECPWAAAGLKHHTLNQPCSTRVMQLLLKNHQKNCPGIRQIYRFHPSLDGILVTPPPWCAARTGCFEKLKKALQWAASSLEPPLCYLLQGRAQKGSSGGTDSQEFMVCHSAQMNQPHTSEFFILKSPPLRQTLPVNSGLLKHAEKFKLSPPLVSV